MIPSPRKTLPRFLLLTALLTSCASQTLPQPPTGPESGIAGLPILRDTNADSTNGVFFGIFRERPDHSKTPDEVSKDLRFKPATVMWYSSWKGNTAFPKAEVLALSQQGVVPNITWEPWDWSVGVDDPKQIKLKDILDGKWDAYIRSWAKEAKAVNVPFMLRWGHEFNGNWYPTPGRCPPTDRTPKPT